MIPEGKRASIDLSTEKLQWWKKLGNTQFLLHPDKQNTMLTSLTGEQLNEELSSFIQQRKENQTKYLESLEQGVKPPKMHIVTITSKEKEYSLRVDKWSKTKISDEIVKQLDSKSPSSEAFYQSIYKTDIKNKQRKPTYHCITCCLNTTKTLKKISY